MPNIWKQFTDLLPGSPRFIGEVIDQSGDGSVTVELPGGGLLKATGTAAVGTKVFVRNGLVEGVAPELPVVEIEV